MRLFVMILAAIIVVVVLVAYVLVRFNADKVADFISQRVAVATHRPFVVSDLNLSFYPRLGFSIGESRWGAPQQDGVSGSVRGARVYLALGPLLRGRIEVDDCFVDQPQVLVRPADQPHVAKVHSGAGGKASAVGSTDSSGDRMNDKSAPLAFLDRIGGLPRRLEIRNGDVQMPVGKDTARLSGLNLLLSAGEESSRSGDLKTSAQLTLDRGEDTLTILLSLQGLLRVHEHALVLEHVAAVLDRTRVHGSARLTLPQGPNVNSNTGLGTGTNIVANTGPGTGSNTGSNSSQNIGLTVALNADALDLNPYLYWFLASATGKSALLKPDDPSQPVFSSAASPASPSSASILGERPETIQTATQQVDVDLSLELGKLIVRELALDTIKLRLRHTQGRWEVEPGTLNLFGGVVTLKGRLDPVLQNDPHIPGSPGISGPLQTQARHYVVDGTFDNLNLDAASHTLAGKACVAGSMSAKISLAGMLVGNGTGSGVALGSGTDVFLRGLEGTGSLTGQGVGIDNACLSAELLKRLNGRRLVFESAEGLFAVHHGVIAIQRMSFAGRGFAAQVTGEVDLPGDRLMLDGTLNAVGVPLPFRLTGTLHRPAFKLNADRLLRETIGGVGKLLLKKL